MGLSIIPAMTFWVYHVRVLNGTVHSKGKWFTSVTEICRGFFRLSVSLRRLLGTVFISEMGLVATVPVAFSFEALATELVGDAVDSLLLGFSFTWAMVLQFVFFFSPTFALGGAEFDLSSFCLGALENCAASWVNRSSVFRHGKILRVDIHRTELGLGNTNCNQWWLHPSAWHRFTCGSWSASRVHGVKYHIKSSLQNILKHFNHYNLSHPWYQSYLPVPANLEAQAILTINDATASMSQKSLILSDTGAHACTSARKAICI